MSAQEENDDLLDPKPCSVCRGTGTVISNLGGSANDQPCPWCDGTGTFLPDHDAQAARREGDGGDAGAAGGSAASG